MAGTGDPYMRTYGENGRDLPYNLQSDNYGHAHYSSNGVHISEPVIAPSPIPANATLLGRSKQQLTTQQVTQVTKVIREVQHLGPDGQPLDYNPYGVTTAPGAGPRYATANYEHIGVQEPLYRTHSPASEAGSRRYPEYRTYADYDQYGVVGPGGPGPGTGPGPGSHSQGGGLYYPDLAHPHHPAHYMDAGPGPGGVAGPPMMYADRPPTPPSPSERSQSPPPHQTLPRDYGRQSVPYPTGYPELDVTMGQQSDRYAYERAPSTSGYRESPGPNTPLYARGAYENMAVNGLSPAHAHNHPHVMHRDYEDTGSAPSPRVVYDDEGMAPPPPARERDLYGTMSPPSGGMGQPADSSGVRWRDPDLHEVIAFLQNPNSVVRANAAAYLQHLCYSADAVKQQTRLLGGIPPLVALLSHDVVDVHRNACGALRNLSYGRQNDENKRALHKAGGIPALIRLLQRSPDQDVRELVTSVLWNLSSCEELKRPILDEAVLALVQLVVIPHSGWDRTSPGPTHWSPLFRNATGVLRNISSAGEHARKTMREMEGVIEALLYVVRGSLDPAHQQMDNKSVENCVCVLRNLSYRCQEVEDPNYDKHPLPSGSGTTSGGPSGTPRSQATPSQEPSGCFGGGRKKKDGQDKGTPSSPSSHSQQTQEKVRTEPPKGMELLWQPEVVQPYLALLSNCSNPETLEAAAGAIQNLAACYWQPAIDVRAAVRKEKGLPVLVELLRMEVDRVVCAVATALRNLALDQRNKELIGKYAMRDLVQKLPATASGHDTPSGASDDTVAAVLATLHEVIKKNAEFARSLLDEGGVDRLVALSRQRGRYSSRVVKFASQVLSALWGHQELRDVYKKMGWKESDFVQKGGPTTSSSASSTNNGSAIGGSGLGSGSGGREPSSPGAAANSTLNRPMASQGGTRYEDKTLSLHRPHAQPKYRNEEVPLADMQYPEGSSHAPPVGGVRIFPPQPKPGEPVYAQVNREKKRSRQYDGGVDGTEEGGAQQWAYDEQPHTQPTNRAHMEGQPGGDSWV